MSVTTTQRRVTPRATLILPADTDRDTWLAARREGIGSSDIPAILGVSTYRTPAHVYHDKRGELTTSSNVGEAALWGNLHEETVAREWARRNRSVIRRVGLIARIDQPWMMCTLDRLVTECPLDRASRGTCAVEIKTRNAFTAGKWRRDVPDDVLAQVLWQIAVTGFDHLHVAVLIGGNDYRQYVIRAAGNEQLADDIVTIAGRLWHDHIATGRPPAPTGTDDPDALVDLYDQLHPDRDGVIHLDDTPDAYDDLVAYEQARLAETAARKAKETAKAHLIGHLQGSAFAVLDGGLAYSYEPSLRRSPDLDRLAERWPDAYADCVPDKPSRRLTIAKPYRLKPKETTS